ncbi:MAG: cobyrinate a,c-diamide synthase [Desulfonatronovibrionaceae bacterium]
MSILVSATGSGAGKTSVFLALAAVLKERGQDVTPFKAGPDFLDPMHLGSICATPCYNLDTWMSPAPHVSELLNASRGVSLIEGVMGYYDGGGKNGTRGSAAELASLLGSTVILVAPCCGMSESFAALVWGFCGLSRFGEQIKGVVANGCGSDRHRKILEASLESHGLPPLVGAVPRQGVPRIESRHLGLVPEEEQGPGKKFSAFARTGEKYLDVDRILALDMGQMPEAVRTGPTTLRRGPRIGVARDKAFNFYYQANLDKLRECGAELVYFSPLQDRSLPDSLKAIYLGGGYPEIFAPALAGNRVMKNAIAKFAGRGGHIYAECGGMIYLGAALRDAQGEEFAMCGVLSLDFRMLPKRRALGYVQLELLRDCLLGKTGRRLRGHEFHYSELATKRPEAANIYRTENSRGEEVDAAGFIQDNVLASYVHVYFGHSEETVRHILTYIG